MDTRPPDHTATSSDHMKTRDGTLLRTVAWGACAAFAAAVLVFVAQTPAGGERINKALAETLEPATVSEDPDLTVRALEARIAALTGDRDRLAKRVAALESGVSDLTGSVRRQASAPPSSPLPPAPAVVATAAPSAPLAMIVAVAPPLINPLATPPAGVASILPETATPQRTASVPDEIPTPTEAPREVMVPESATPAAPAPEETPTGSIPNQPERKPEAARPSAPAHGRAEFGVELATESNMDGLRKRWAAVKANHGPLLTGLSPVAVRDQHPGSTRVRLVAGPLPSLTAARQLCARFAAVNGDCWPARINPSEVVQR